MYKNLINLKFNIIKVVSENSQTLPIYKRILNNYTLLGKYFFVVNTYY